MLDNNLYSFSFSDAGSCKHAVALMFALADFHRRTLDRATAVGTDEPRVWSVPRRESQPKRMEEMQFFANRDASHLPTPSNYKPITPVDTSRIRSKLLALATRTVPNSMLCRHLTPPTPQPTAQQPQAAARPQPLTQPQLPTMGDLAQQHVILGGTVEDFIPFLRQAVTPGVCHSCQRLQQGAPTWTEQRMGRVTASSALAVTRFSGKNPDGALVKQVVKGSKFSTPATRFGHDNEDFARQLYIFAHQARHPAATVMTTGLHLDADQPFIAASPDGLVECPECGPGLVEVKCSYKYRDLLPEEAIRQKGSSISVDENQQLSLRVKSSWYYQIQCQLGVCKRDWCDLAFFTTKGIAIVRTTFNQETWEEVVSKGNKFFRTFVFPKLTA